MRAIYPGRIKILDHETVNYARAPAPAVVNDQDEV